MKSNLISEVQDLGNPNTTVDDKSRAVLDFDSIETNQMSLIERARLFVHLRHGAGARPSDREAASKRAVEHQTSIKNFFSAVKFKTIRHTMVSDSVLPPKGELIQVCQNVYKVNHSKLKLTGLASLKDRVIMAIYIAAKVQGEEDLLAEFKRALGSRETLVSELDKYSAVAEKAEEKAPNQIHTTLEVNLMLAFLFTAGLLCKVPLLEKDVLVGAQRN